MTTTMQVNELTEIDLIICHLEEEDQENFCIAWYFGLDHYKENEDALLIMANATLNHWEIPLYAVGIIWSPQHNCFIWIFGDNTSPDYTN